MKVSQVSQLSALRRQASRVRSGYTLLEMVIVMAIIALIIGGAITYMNKIVSGGEQQRVTTDIKSFDNVLSVYKMNNGDFPTTQQGLAALVVRPTSAPQPKKWSQLMKKVPTDPWNQEYLYRNPGSKDPSTYEVYTKGPDRQVGTDDDISSQDPE
jgi:general secretion pathway protein G